jgi:hypothetical protein
MPKADKHVHNTDCGTCGRNTVRCPECQTPYPNGAPGWWDRVSWHTGPRPVPAPRSRLVVAAERSLEVAQDTYDQLTREWQQAAAEQAQARQRDAKERRPALMPDGDMREVGAVDRGLLRDLAAAEQAARERRDDAGRSLVEARMAVREATKGVA